MSMYMYVCQNTYVISAYRYICVLEYLSDMSPDMSGMYSVLYTIMSDLCWSEYISDVSEYRSEYRIYN